MKALMWVGIALAAAVALPGVLVVDVREGGADGTHIVVPVPLVLAHAALPFIPRQARAVHCSPDYARWAPLADRAVAELSRQPDFTLVEVREADETALVRKTGRCLTVDVTDGDETVHCRVPLKCAAAVLAATRDGRLRPGEFSKALWALPAGDIVRVDDGHDKVRIWKL